MTRYLTRKDRFRLIKSPPPCTRCGQPSVPGLSVCEQCERDERKEAQSHAVKGQTT